jgi:hypothetical protein
MLTVRLWRAERSAERSDAWLDVATCSRNRVMGAERMFWVYRWQTGSDRRNGGLPAPRLGISFLVT